MRFQFWMCLWPLLFSERRRSSPPLARPGPPLLVRRPGPVVHQREQLLTAQGRLLRLPRPAGGGPLPSRLPATQKAGSGPELQRLRGRAGTTAALFGTVGCCECVVLCSRTDSGGRAHLDGVDPESSGWSDAGSSRRVEAKDCAGRRARPWGCCLNVARTHQPSLTAGGGREEELLLNCLWECVLFLYRSNKSSSQARIEARASR